MKILNRYVARDFFVAFFMSIGILTFGMMGARMVEVFELVSRGIPLADFFWFTAYTLPVVLTFTIPWSVLVATMMVFGRLSADSEITAMRACGVSILQVIAPLLLIALAMTGICLYLQVEAGPPMLGKARSLMKDAAKSQPMALFEPGVPINYENNIIYIDDKTAMDTVTGVTIFTFNDQLELKQDIVAERGKLSVDEEKLLMTVTLFNCVIRNTDEGKDQQRIFNEQAQFTIDYGKQLNMGNVGARPKYMPLDQLLARIKISRRLPNFPPERLCDLEVELNRRIAMALSPIAFLLLGLPLAIRTSRRETSVGLFLSVILGGVFFLSVIVCESVTKFYFVYPQYLIWLPNLIYQSVGAVMIYKVSQQ